MITTICNKILIIYQVAKEIRKASALRTNLLYSKVAELCSDAFQIGLDQYQSLPIPVPQILSTDTHHVICVTLLCSQANMKSVGLII